MSANRTQWFLGHFESLAPGQAAQPEMPIEIILHQAQALANQARGDFEALSAQGLLQDELTTLEELILVCRETQKNWAGSLRSIETVSKEWKITNESAQNFYQLLANILHHAFRGLQEPMILAIHKQASEMYGRELARGLYDLQQTARENFAILSVNDISPTGINHASSVADRLIATLEGVLPDEKTDIEKLNLRNQAYTRLTEACGRIQEMAQKAFADNPDKLDDYNRIFASQPHLMVLDED